MAIDYRYYFDFRSATVGVNPIGFHALRNDVIKRSISWDQIAQLRIQRGMDYNNWLIMLILGGAMAGGGLSLMAASIENIPKGEYWFPSYLRFNFYSLTCIGLGLLVFSSACAAPWSQKSKPETAIGTAIPCGRLPKKIKCVAWNFSSRNIFHAAFLLNARSVKAAEVQDKSGRRETLFVGPLPTMSGVGRRTIRLICAFKPSKAHIPLIRSSAHI
jgi:hypothetical protein